MIEWLIYAGLFWVFLLAVIYLCLSFGFFRFGIPFIPTEKLAVKKMIELAALEKKDSVVEIGCGDGRLVFCAAETAHHSVGYEGVFFVYLLAKIRKFVGRRKGELCYGNFYKADLSQYDVVFAYLSNPIMKKFYQKKWKELKPGCRIISNAFTFPSEIPIKMKVNIGKGHIYVYEKKPATCSILVSE